MPVFVETEVGGIQKYIFSTGKLKEMIGGSEIIHYICQQAFYDDILREIGCAKEVKEETEGGGWHLVVQNNAGTLCLMLPDADTGRAFLGAFSRKVLENFPGLPLYGAMTSMPDWSKDSLKQAHSLAGEKTSRQRMTGGIALGLPMLPVLRAAPLDALPAVCKESRDRISELISLPSLGRRNPEMLKLAEERLKTIVDLKNTPFFWTNDLADLTPDGGKIALIHMDGNSMGNLIDDEKRKCEGASLIETVRKLGQLSKNIEEINNAAFAYTLKQILDFVLRHDVTAVRGERLVIPLRPLVMAGDDITMIVRADLALAFVSLFVSCYEREAQERGLPLSLGVGMVIMNSWPFSRAFALAEDLTRSAKKLTENFKPRPSSLDYLVLTEDVEDSVSDLRKRVYTAPDGCLLTAKPFALLPGMIAEFLKNGEDVLQKLPRSAMRQALVACSHGQSAAQAFYENTKKNLNLGIGGRNGHSLQLKDFEKLFPQGFFQADGARTYTLLGDYLEQSRLMPQENDACRELLSMIEAGGSRYV